MSTTTTYAVTMAELKAETQHGTFWSNYGNPVQMGGRFHPQESPVGVQGPVSGPPTVPSPASHLARPRSRQQSQPHPMDYPQHYQHRPSHDEGDGYDRYPHPTLMNIPGINSLKRSYSQVDQPPYTEMVQDLREDYNKPNQDQKLLSFKPAGEKHTIVDSKGRMQEIEIEAQLHGMFFLSELSSTGDGSVFGAELTCYRRNLFQISGNITFPYSPLSVMLSPETGETSQIKSMELSISATESVDGHPVRLIVIPWKTPPPNSPEVAQQPDQEPPPLPLIPCQDPMGATPQESEGDEYAVHPIGWRRLQFRIATANNGRRKELQQHFLVHLRLHGTLANGSKVLLQEQATAPIVVRGRSPRNFQARKEIPLLGSSAGSRGQTLVETGHGIIAAAYVLNKPSWQSRPKVPSLELPRTAFTFSGPKGMPPSPMGMRSNSYPSTTWAPSSQVSMAHSAPAPSYAATMAQESYAKMPLSGGPGFTAEPQEMPMQQTSMPSVQLSLAAPDHQQAPIRTQYATYVHSTTAPPPQMSLSMPSTASDSIPSLSVPRYVDHNPRPHKSPRHGSHTSVHSNSSLSNDASTGEYRYGPPSYGANGPHSASDNLSPTSLPPPLPHHQQAQPPHALPDPTAPPPHGGLVSVSGPPAPQHPQRDYYPSSQPWATTVGEHSQPSVSYQHGHEAVRPYAQLPLPPPPPPAQPYPGQAMSHYAWNTT